MARQVYKEYSQGEILLFPPSIESMVPHDSPARLVDYVIQQLDIHELLGTYKGGGTSSYHPRMLLKVIKLKMPHKIIRGRLAFGTASSYLGGRFSNHNMATETIGMQT